MEWKEEKGNKRNQYHNNDKQDLNHNQEKNKEFRNQDLFQKK